MGSEMCIRDRYILVIHDYMAWYIESYFISDKVKLHVLALQSFGCIAI